MIGRIDVIVARSYDEDMDNARGGSWGPLFLLWSFCFLVNTAVFLRIATFPEPISVLRSVFRDIFVSGVHGSDIPEIIVVMMSLGLVITITVLLFKPSFWPKLLFFDRSTNDEAPLSSRMHGPYYSGMVILSGVISFTATFTALFLVSFLRD